MRSIEAHPVQLTGIGRQRIITPIYKEFMIKDPTIPNAQRCFCIAYADAFEEGTSDIITTSVGTTDINENEILITYDRSKSKLSTVVLTVSTIYNKEPYSYELELSRRNWNAVYRNSNKLISATLYQILRQFSVKFFTTIEHSDGHSEHWVIRDPKPPVPLDISVSFTSLPKTPSSEHGV